MDPHALVETVLMVGTRYSIDTKDMRALVLKLIVMSVKYVSRSALWLERFGEDYVDWTLVDSHPGRNVLGGCPEWLGLLGNCGWEGLAKLESSLAVSHPPLHCVRTNMRECGLDTGGPDGWTLACKILLITLIQGLPTLHALEVLTCAAFRRNTHAGCMQLLAKQAESLFTPAQYEAALHCMLDHCVVQSQALEQTLALARASREEHKVNLKMSRMTVMQGRPRLRDRVSSVLRTEERKAQVDALLDTWESYTGFCYKHQFPPTLSERIKSRLYFLAAQTRWEWQRHLRKVLPSAGELLAKVAAHPITQPDLPVITRVIEGLSMDGSAPFAQMTSFRTACFLSFPVTHVQRMTLSQILQLYVASYQAPLIWKEAWKHLVGVISVQIIRDVEAFVARTPFAEDDLMRLLLTGGTS